MIIAVSVNGTNADSPLEPRFGRAAGFMLYDDVTGEFSFLANGENSQLSQGAGIQSAQMLADHDVKVVVSGRFGPKATDALQRGGIRMVEVSGGTVREAVEIIAKGNTSDVKNLNADSNASVPNGMSSGQGVGRAGGGCRRMGGSGRGMGAGRGTGRGMGGGRSGMGKRNN